MELDDNVKRSITEWLAKIAFDEEKIQDEYRSKIEELVHGILTGRFSNYREKIEVIVGKLEQDASEQDHWLAMSELLNLIVCQVILEAAEKEDSIVEKKDLNRLTKMVSSIFQESHQISSAVLRCELGEPQPGDEEVQKNFLETVIKNIKEICAMNDLIDSLSFDFDRSILPKGFEEKQDDFAAAVEKALAILRINDPIFHAATIGLLLIEGQTDPKSAGFFKYVQRIHAELTSSADPDLQVSLAEEGEPTLFFPNGAQRIIVYNEALKVLNEDYGISEIFYQDFARLGRKASDAYKQRKPGSIGFEKLVRNLFFSGVTGDAAGDGGDIGRIELPPLSDSGGTGDEIEPDNIRAVATIYVAYQLEQMRFFQTTDRIVELFMAGLLPIGYDEGARKLDTFYWEREDRLSEAERWSQYSRALGATGGQVSQDVNPNMDFNTLLLRFISSVSEFERQQSIGNLFDGRAGVGRSLTTTGEYVRKAGRDLAANISLYGWAGTYFAAERLSRHVKRSLEILQMSQVREAFGVNTWGQVIERVVQREFGSTVNVVKHRTLGEETRKMLEMIAAKHAIWGLSSNRPLFTLRERENHGDEGELSYQETQNLFRSVQYWLAVNGVQDTTVDEYRQPTETVASPSLPSLGLTGMGGGGNGGSAPGVSELRDMVSQGQMPSMEQLRRLLPNM
jgi:hypothetical protein